MTIQVGQKKSLKLLARHFGLDFVVVFGSQVSGQTHPGSDLDLGYSLARKNLSDQQRFELDQKLQKIFPEHEIDLVNLRQVSPILQHRAVFKGRLLVENHPHSFARFQMSAYINYIDTSFLRILRDQHLAKKYA